MAEETTPMLTPAELAKRLGMSDETARSIMRKEPGVIRLTRGTQTQYRMTEAAYQAFLARHSKATKKGGKQ